MEFTEKDEQAQNGKIDEKLTISISTSDVNAQQNDNEKEKQDEQPSLFHIFKEHLTCEMYDAILIVCVTPHLILKIFLGLFLLLAHGFAAYTTIELILTYLKYDVITTSRTIYETPSVFPKVTVCNLNQFTTLNGWKYVSKYYNDSILTNLTYYVKYFENFMAGNLALNLLSTNELKKSIGHSLDDVLIGCKFNYQECNSSDFKWEFDRTYGNCFSFNSGFNSTGQAVDLKKSSLAGSSYGLQLDLYVNYYENLTLFNSVGQGVGAIIRIDNVTNVIDHVTDGILASAGFYTNIALGRENKFIMKAPYSECVLDNDLYTHQNSFIYEAILNSGYTYSQQFCLSQCAQKLIIDMCGCYIPFLSSVFNGSKCNTDASFTCAQINYSNIYNANDYVNRECLPLCPLECNSTRFTFTLSTSKLLGNPYVDIIKNRPNLSADFVTQHVNVNTVRESIAKVNIFYDSLSYVNIEESPALDIWTLVANMGGNWGLFLSVNLFSIAEIVTTLIEIYFYKRDNYKIRTKKIME